MNTPTQPVAPEPTYAQKTLAVDIFYHVRDGENEVAYALIASSEAAAVAKSEEKAEHYRLAGLKSDVEILRLCASISAAHAREASLHTAIGIYRVALDDVSELEMCEAL